MFKASPTHKKVDQMEVGWISYLDFKLCKYEGSPDLLVERIFFQSIVKWLEKNATQLTHSIFTEKW